MNRFEERIRDFLAGNLKLIEPDLILIRKEYRLKNILGSDGSIDILAKDGLGHYVIIEVKRSNQAARAALHELTKYVALLRSSLGVPAEKIRAILVSTEWKELAVPFSEYQKISEVPTAGYKISADDSGEVVQCTKFTPSHIEQGLCISRQQILILYKNSKKRNDGIDVVARAAIQSQLSDFAILTANYNGQDSGVIYPFGIYFGFSSPISEPESEESRRIVKSLQWDEDLDDPDENFLCAIMDDIHGNDTAEIGYPEKLSLMKEQGWSTSVAVRNGRYQKNIELLSDDQLQSEFMKTEGGANYYLQHTSAPKYLPSWTKFKSDVFLVLMGSERWESFFKIFTKEVEADCSLPTVSVSIYNPGDILLGLSNAFAKNDFRYMPSFQLYVSGGKQTTIYLGRLAWDGVTKSTDAAKWLERSYDSLESYFIMRAFGEQYMNEDLACDSLGIQHVVYEIVNPGRADESIFAITFEDGLNFSRAKIAEKDLLAMQGFYDSHMVFGRRLGEIVRSCSQGFIN